MQMTEAQIASDLVQWTLEIKSKPSLLIYVYNLNGDEKDIVGGAKPPLEDRGLDNQSRRPTMTQPSRYLLDLCTEINRDKLRKRRVCVKRARVCVKRMGCV